MSHGKSTTIAGVTLRPIRSDDEAFLLRVYGSTRADELSQLDWDNAQKDAFVRMQFDAQHRYYSAQFPGARFDIIEMGDQPVGRFYVDRREAEIRVIDIALLPEYQKMGIGGVLMQELLNEAAKTHKRVSLHVEQFNPAMRLYKRLGFAHIRDEGIYQLMEWAPPPKQGGS